MAKKSKSGQDAVLAAMREKLVELGYTEIVEDLELLDLDPDDQRTCPLVAMDGDEVVVFCWPVASGLAQQVAIQDDGVFWSRLIAGDRIANFVWISDGETSYVFDNGRNTAIAELPLKQDWRDLKRGMSDHRKRQLIDVSAEYAKGNWRQVQKQFDQLHEKLYPNGGISTANEAIDEICRLMFVKIHLERCPAYTVKAVGGKRLSDLFGGDALREFGRVAVQELKAAFKEIATLDEYQTADQFGDKHGIFPEDDYLRLDRPEILAFAVEILEGMPRLVMSATGNPAEEVVREDLLGWAYDVFLRGKYVSSGGLATYLTPTEVTEAMALIALHDITDAELWAGFRGMTEQSVPQFVMGDFTCGTGRFLMKYLDKVRQRIWNTLGKSENEKRFWFRRIVEHGVIAADQSKESLIKARLNMLLYGGIHTQLWTVQDSLLDHHVDGMMGRMSLIMTNPPFGSGTYTDPTGLRKMRSDPALYAEPVRGLLDEPRYQCELGWNWSTDKSKRKALDAADPAALFLDRNLQLLRPGGRLLIVLPDGILCNSGYKNLREYLMGTKDEETGEFFGGKAVVKAVVSLPTQTFAISGTGAKTSFLYVQKKGIHDAGGGRKVEVQKQGPIFMAVAEHVGYEKKGKGEVVDPMGNDLQPIADAYCAGEVS